MVTQDTEIAVSLNTIQKLRYIATLLEDVLGVALDEVQTLGYLVHNINFLTIPHGFQELVYATELSDYLANRRTSKEQKFTGLVKLNLTSNIYNKMTIKTRELDPNTTYTHSMMAGIWAAYGKPVVERIHRKYIAQEKFNNGN
jgi:hypothetical protein